MITVQWPRRFIVHGDLDIKIKKKSAIIFMTHLADKQKTWKKKKKLNDLSDAFKLWMRVLH